MDLYKCPSVSSLVSLSVILFKFTSPGVDFGLQSLMLNLDNIFSTYIDWLISISSPSDEQVNFIPRNQDNCPKSFILNLECMDCLTFFNTNSSLAAIIISSTQKRMITFESLLKRM